METAVQPCAYHEDRPSVATCSECGAAVCEECRQEVAGHVVCTRCVENIRAKVAAEIETEQPATPPSDVPQPLTTFPGPPAVEQPGAELLPPIAAATPSIPIPPPSPARIVLGVVAGLIVGWIGAWIRAQVMYRANIQFGLIDSFIGFAVGFAVMLGSGRSGIVPAIIGAVLSFGAITYGWYLFEMYRADAVLVQLRETLSEVAGTPVRGGIPSFFDLAPDIIRSWRVMDWLFVAIGVYGGFITPMRSSGPSTESGAA